LDPAPATAGSTWRPVPAPSRCGPPRAGAEVTGLDLAPGLIETAKRLATERRRHTLRRTFASILAQVGVSPRRAMYLLGHEDPTLTMRIYQQVLDMGGAGVDVLESVLGCDIKEAFTIYSGREETGPKPDS
jgi:integrase